MNVLPKYYETFIPILEVLKDGKIIHYNDLRKLVRDTYYIDLPAELLAQTTKDGDQLILNRIGWGKAYLKQAGYVDQPSRAMVQITDKGLEALKRGRLSLADVKSDPDFLAHRAQVKQNSETQVSDEEQTPQDMIDSGVQAIENNVKAELLEKLRGHDPYDFERIVNDLLVKMGYGEAEGTTKSGDGGIDGVINQDKLGLQKIYVQAKRYKDGNKVHETDIRNFIGAMSGDTDRGIFVTTSDFDDRAVKKAQSARHTIILIGGSQLVKLMYRYGVGVQVANTYDIKQLDEDYFI